MNEKLNKGKNSTTEKKSKAFHQIWVNSAKGNEKKARKERSFIWGLILVFDERRPKLFWRKFRTYIQTFCVRLANERNDRQRHKNIIEANANVWHSSEFYVRLFLFLLSLDTKKTIPNHFVFCLKPTHTYRSRANRVFARKWRKKKTKIIGIFNALQCE